MGVTPGVAKGGTSPLIFGTYPCAEFIALPDSEGVSAVGGFAAEFVVYVSSMGVFAVGYPTGTGIARGRITIVVPCVTTFLIPLLRSSGSFTPVLRPIVVTFT